MQSSEIKSKLPYGPSFLFVDEILSVDDNGIEGVYTYNSDAEFFRDHFPGNPIIPGVILIETMAQIGLVCFGIYLMREKTVTVPKFAFTSSNVEFYKIVLPGQKVRVLSKKSYFRLAKLKCTVEMLNEAGELIAKGEMSGMMIK